jgi:protoporphyrinogen oxidase
MNVIETEFRVTGITRKSESEVYVTCNGKDDDEIIITLPKDQAPRLDETATIVFGGPLSVRF